MCKHAWCCIPHLYTPVKLSLYLYLSPSGAENVERVLFTIIQGAVDFPDPIAQKTCFIILTKLVELWGMYWSGKWAFALWARHLTALKVHWAFIYFLALIY